MEKIKGYLRTFESGDELKSSIYWSSLKETYLNFYKDKSSKLPVITINLEESEVKSEFSKKYNTNLIEVKTKHQQTFLIIPNEVRDFDKWLISLKELSNRNKEYKSQKQDFPISKDQRKRYVPRNEDKAQNQDTYSRNRKHKPSTLRDYPGPRDRSDSHASGQHKKRVISTVKEDPTMGDDEILETKPIEELRRKYPISDKTKRWSIAATDLVGKSNDELFIMLIQLNREKSHMDVWKETLEKELLKIDETLKYRNQDGEKSIVESNRERIVEQLNEMEYMINLAHPLISFLESVVQMSDVYQGDNQTFHVVYHEHPPSGKEDFSNINFIRHNQEREVARLINENQYQFQSSDMPYNSLKSSMRSENRLGKENNPELALNLKASEKYTERRNDLTEVLEDIESQLSELDPVKNGVEKFLEDFNMKSTDNSVNQVPLQSASKSLKDIKSINQKEKVATDLSLMPRRSTRKSPASDMYPSLSRSEKLGNQSRSLNRAEQSGKHKRQFSLPKATPRTSRDDEDIYPQYNYQTRSSPSKSKSPSSLKEQTSQKTFDSTDKRSVPKDQSHYRDIDFQPQIVKSKRPNNADYFDIQEGPLIKLNLNRYQTPSRTGSNNVNGRLEYNAESRGSVSNSDISVSSTLINQRMNLNEFISNDTKSWKNPGKSNNPSQFSIPPKVEIKDRYRGSVSNDSDGDQRRNERIRNQVVKENMGRYSEEEIGKRNERENLLHKNSQLAHEASRRSRQL